MAMVESYVHEPNELSYLVTDSVDVLSPGEIRG